MAKLQNFFLMEFTENTNVDSIKSIKVPKNSNLLKFVLIHQGIIAQYSVPDNPALQVVRDSNNPMDRLETEVHRFIMLKGQNPTIPQGALHVDTLVQYFTMPLEEGEEEPKQGVVLFTIFRLQY